MEQMTIKIGGSAKSSAGSKAASPSLFDQLQSRGLLVVDQPHSDFLIAINHNQALYETFIRQGGSVGKAVLIRLEPETVFPLQYRVATTSKYGSVITPGSIVDRSDPTSFVGWPYQYHLNPARPNTDDPSLHSILGTESWKELFDFVNWKSRSRTLTMIAANKVSPLRSANYSIRRRLAKQLAEIPLEVYGPLWTDKIQVKIHHRLAVAGTNLRQGIFPSPSGIYGNLFTNYPSARGFINNKHTLLKESKFSLVIENSNTYVSEKLLDAMINGAIPIYIGAQLEKVGLPSDIAIESSGDPREIARILANCDEERVASTLSAMKAFFESQLFLQTWTEQAVYEQISAQLVTYFEGVPL